MIFSYIDVTDFSQCSPRNYKMTRNVNELIPSEPCFEYSRYEVLQQKIRKLYFDIDGIQNGDFSIVRSFIDKYNEFLMNKNYIDEPIGFACTINSSSANHKGLSAHVIAVSHSMDATKQHAVLLEFLSESPDAEEFKEYIDTSVYSKRQLFKLPHFIGLPMGDMNNYHCITGNNQLSDFVIQNTRDCRYIDPKVNSKPEHKKAERNISFIPRRGNTKMLKNIYEVLLSNTKKNMRDVYKYIDTCNELLLRENITETIKRKLLEIQSDLSEKKNIETSIGLLEHIKQKLDRI